MCREMMIGTCQVCGKEHVELRRKYYYYGIKCDCHSPEHFEIVEYCKECIPEPPNRTTISIVPNDGKITNGEDLEIKFINIVNSENEKKLKDFLINNNIQFVVI